MKKKFLELCLSPDLGGLELYVQRLAKFLEDKIELTVVLNENYKLAKNFKENSQNYIGIKKKPKLYIFSTAKKIANIIDNNQIDLIHIHWTKDLPLAVLAKLISKKKPKLVQSRHMTMTRFKNDLYHRFLYKNTDLLITVTNQLKKQVEKFIPKDIRPKVITSYIGAKVPSKISKEKKDTLIKKYALAKCFTVGIIGRIEKEKGQYLLIDAIKQLKEKNLEVQALIVGHAMEKIYLEKLKEDIKKNDFENNIIFTGFTNEVQNLMQICDAIVLATNKETFGLVLIEAMQCGVCTISTKNGGPLEIIDNKENGLFFNPNNSTDLSLKLEEIIIKKELRLNLAQEGKKKALSIFEEKKQFDEIFNILKGV